MVIITLDTENDAFSPDPCPELHAILVRLADRITLADFHQDAFNITIKDSNGNTVGTFHWRRTE